MDSLKVNLPLNPEDVADIVAILENSCHHKLEIRTDRFVLRVARSGENWTQQWDWNPSEPAAPSASLSSNSPSAPKPAYDAKAHGMVEIMPPLPGTFYRAPQPGAPPFVEEGMSVTENTVVGIVETMKLMNPVHAATRGTVVAILVPDGTLIDANTVLMHVAPEDR